MENNVKRVRKKEAGMRRVAPSIAKSTHNPEKTQEKSTYNITKKNAEFNVF